MSCDKRLSTFPIGTSGFQAELRARAAGERVFATQEIVREVANSGVVLLIQCDQEPVAQIGGGEPSVDSVFTGGRVHDRHATCKVWA